MAISHADHNHPNTPAARAACRKRMNNGQSPMDSSAERALSLNLATGEIKPAKMTVVPRRRGDGGVVKGMKAAAPGNTKKPGTHLRTIGDLPDVPRMLAYCAKLAWAEGWDVIVGQPFNDSESHLVIRGTVAEITAIWRHTMKDGIWALHIRPLDSSKGAGKADSALEAIEIAAGRSPLPGQV